MTKRSFPTALSCINIFAIVWLLYLNVHAGIMYDGGGDDQKIEDGTV